MDDDKTQEHDYDEHSLRFSAIKPDDRVLSTTNPQTTHEEECCPLFEQNWFLQKVFEQLEIKYLLDCSLVNHQFLEVSRSFIKKYLMPTIGTLADAPEKIASAPCLWLRLKSIPTDVFFSCKLPVAQCLTSLGFRKSYCCLGLSYARHFSVNQLKNLDIFQPKNTSEGKVAPAEVTTLANLQSLNVSQPYHLNQVPLSALSSLTELRLQYLNEPKPFFESISLLTKLEHLKVYYPKELSVSETFPVLGTLRQLHSLTIRHLACTKQYLEEVILKMPRLKSLYLKVCGSSSAGVSLRVLSQLQKLQALRIGFRNRLGELSKLGISEISSLTKLAASVREWNDLGTLPCLMNIELLNSLTVRSVSGVNQPVGLDENLSSFKHLTELEVCSPRSEALATIGTLQNLLCLTLVSLQNITFDTCAASCYRRLWKLDIKSPKGGISTLLSSLTVLSSIKVLSLSYITSNCGHEYDNLSLLSCLSELTTFAFHGEVRKDLETLILNVASISNIQNLSLHIYRSPSFEWYEPGLFANKLTNLRWLKICSDLLKPTNQDMLFTSCPKLARITWI